MACVDGRTDPRLWARSKAEAIERLHGRFSARAMQLAGRIYREAGGAYCGPKTRAQRSMTKWTREDWKTAPEAMKRACNLTRGGIVRCDRYLPAAAWKALTPAQRRATRLKKLGAREQWVSNTPRAAAAGARARRRR